MAELLHAENSFDIVSRDVLIGDKNAVFYFVDGFCKDVLMQKLLQFLMGLKADDLPQTATELNQLMPYVEVDLTNDFHEIAKNILCGVFAILIDGFDECILIDSRTYPARGVSEPEKDKVLRGSKDGFVETVVFNTALIRRRIRSIDLRMEMLSAGKASNTDIVLCYMDSRVDQEFLRKIRDRINDIKVDALTLNQESLAECLYTSKWYNPFPKFKYTERPDTAAAQILEGNIIILVDNSPSAMILPMSILDMIQEADDYYFPPVTGSYLRLSRFLILILTYFITPTFLLMMQNPDWIPPAFEFIVVKEDINVPLIWQFLILELAIDGLRLAAVNTPNMLSTPPECHGSADSRRIFCQERLVQRRSHAVYGVCRHRKLHAPQLRAWLCHQIFQTHQSRPDGAFSSVGLYCGHYPVLCCHYHKQDGIRSELSLSADSV